jgi:similar to spore coat protein
MNGNTKLAPHETIELRELLGNEVLGYKKLNSSINVVQDNELKTFMQNCVNNKKTKIEELQCFIETK